MTLDKLPIHDHLPAEQKEYLQKQQREFKHVGKMRKVAGHTLFSFNRKTGEIKPAQFVNKVSLGFDGKALTSTECVIEPDCFYEQALNQANFIKRLKRYGLID